MLPDLVAPHRKRRIDHPVVLPERPALSKAAGEALEDGWSRQWQRLSGRNDFDAKLSSLDTHRTKSLLHEGYAAFQREHRDKEAQRVDTFDPTADEILWLRPLRGG